MLLDAITRGRLYQVKFLLESNSVNINVTDQNGQTPLMKAILLDNKMHHTRYKLVRLLLDHGAKVNIADRNGKTALMLATILGHEEIAERILKTSILDLDLNAGDLEGNTALIHAASMGQTNLVSILINYIKRFGLDVDKKNNLGMTAMLEATRKGHGRTAEVLMVEGDASLTIRDPYNYMNAFEWAVQNELHDLVELITTKQELLEAKSQDFDENGNTDDSASKLEIPEEEQQVEKKEDLTSEPRRDALKKSLPRKKNITVSRIMQSLCDTSLDECQLESIKPVANRQELYKETQPDLAVSTSHESEAKRVEDSNVNSGCRSSFSAESLTRRKSFRPRLRSASSGLRLNAKSEFQRLIELYGVQSSQTYRKGYDLSTLPPSGMWPDPLANFTSLSNSCENLSIMDRDDYFNDSMPSRTNSRRSVISEGPGRRMAIVGAPREGRKASIASGGITDRRRKMTVGNFQGKGEYETLGRKPSDRKMSLIARPNMERPTLTRRMHSTMGPLISS